MKLIEILISENINIHISLFDIYQYIVMFPKPVLTCTKNCPNIAFWAGLAILKLSKRPLTGLTIKSPIKTARFRKITGFLFSTLPTDLPSIKVS